MRWLVRVREPYTPVTIPQGLKLTTPRMNTHSTRSTSEPESPNHIDAAPPDAERNNFIVFFVDSLKTISARVFVDSLKTISARANRTPHFISPTDFFYRVIDPLASERHHQYKSDRARRPQADCSCRLRRLGVSATAERRRTKTPPHRGRGRALPIMFFPK